MLLLLRISPMRLIAPVIGLRRTTAPIASSMAFLKPSRRYSERMISTRTGVTSERGTAPIDTRAELEQRYLRLRALRHA